MNICLFLQISVFGGSAWEWREERQQFYLHQFVIQQPDLNYENPDVVEEMKVRTLNKSSAYDLIPRHAVAVMYSGQ